MHHFNMLDKRHYKVVISDCHLGTGSQLSDGSINPLEEFRKDEKFVELLEFYSTGIYHPSKAHVELIINGDFFDMLVARTSSETPYEIFESIAVYKIRRILRGHPLAVNALKRFMESGHHIKYIWGNHDAGIWWPAVQEEIRAALGHQLEIMFTPYEFDRVRIEHGHQYEIMHQFDIDRIFIQKKGKTLLNYPFGSFYVAGFVTKLKLRRPYISQVVPFGKFLRWAFIFDFKFAIVNGAKALWFFFLLRFVSHPYRFARISKTFKILGEILNKPDYVKVSQKVMKEKGCQILILGHNHQATHRTFSDGTQYVNTGTWTDITSFDVGTLGRLSKATYAYIEYPPGAVPGKGVIPRVNLRVWKGRHKEWEEFEI